MSDTNVNAHGTNGITLLPCPLCSSHAHPGEDCSSYHPMRHYVCCDNQECRLFELPGRSGMFDTPEEAADDWNAMPRWDTGKERIAELERKLEHAKAAYPGNFVFTFTDSEYDEMQRTLREKDASINALDLALTDRDELIRHMWMELRMLQAGVFTVEMRDDAISRLGERVDALGIMEVDA